MPVVKHLYVLSHVSTYCKFGILTVTLPASEYAHVLDRYMGGCMGHGGGYVTMYKLCNRSGF
jgi:hypothetical protein